MSRRGAIRRMFPGGNTSRGFVSFFDYVLPGAGYTFVLKGGPGTGKSTFMNRLAADALSAGIDVEFHHCSADPESVDAVAFPALRIAVVDGTAPHVVEPERYEVTGEIVDLGRWCDGKGLRRHKDRIGQLRIEAREAFARSYRWLAAARLVQKDWAEAHRSVRSESLQRHTLAATAAELMDGEGQTRFGPAPGYRRRLFASSITPDGPRHHLDSLLEPLRKVFLLTGEPGTGRHEFMEAAARIALERGYDTETFHCPVDPDAIDHVIVPALGIGFVSSVPPHEYESDSSPIRGRRVETLSLPFHPREADPLPDDRPPEPSTGRGRLPTDSPVARRAATARRTFWKLYGHGIEALQDARAAHLALEAVYKPYVDFDGVEETRLEIRDRILTRQVGAASIFL